MMKVILDIEIMILSYKTIKLNSYKFFCLFHISSSSDFNFIVYSLFYI